MSYILDSIKQKFGVEEKYETEGFPDLNYQVGNTSGLDVAPGVPSAMDERIGSLAQRGGSVMEVIINNPSTFQIDKERMLNIINQLGIDISIHSDPSIGFASAYKTQSQGGIGYDPAHQYFTSYLTQFAIFKKEVDERDDLDFKISRINPHISTSPLPSLQERMAADVGQDPFGNRLTENNRGDWKSWNNAGQNIFKNEEFLKKFYHTFLKHRTVDQMWRLFVGRQGVFSNYSAKFDRIFRDAQRRACENFYDRELKELEDEDELKAKVAMVSTAGRADVGVEDEWLSQIEEPFDESVELICTEEQEQQLLEEAGYSEVTSLDDVNDFLPMNTRVTRLGTLSEAIYKIRNKDFNIPRDLRRAMAWEDIENSSKVKDQLKQKALTQIDEKLDNLWRGPSGDKFLISVQGKIRAITNHLDIEQQRIFERSMTKKGVDPEANGKEWKLDEAVEEVISGNPDFFEEADNPEVRYQKMMNTLTGTFEQQIWMESNLFYFIIPCWMSEASKSYDGHDGWEAPEFVWKALVKNKWESKEKDDGSTYTIDLTDPEGSDYFYLLENNREFQLDVAAASSIAFVWGHFTQREGHFQVNQEQYVEDLDEHMTWIDWMNEYGIGVNLEAMPGGPQQLLKIWRPKDIVTACRAINMTAQKELDEIHEDLDGRPAKFTIDLEHTATFGVNPWKEMEKLIEQEKELAESDIAEEYGIDIDEEKPLAKVLRMWHLMRPGMETSQSETLHGPWDRGDTQLYKWLYHMVDAGFCCNPDEEGWIMYEVGGDDRGTVYMARIAMNLIELGVTPEELDPGKVDPAKDEYSDEKEALMARFFGMDQPSYDREWAKIEEHAFDPLKGLLEAEEFDFTWSGRAAVENDNRPAEWNEEEFR